jgi:hypothetical protein
MVKARVVSLWESDDKLACTLVARIDSHAGVAKPLRVHEGDQLEEQVRLRLE